MENSFGSLLSSAKSILVLLPSKPYFDQVAAGLSLYLALKGHKESMIYCSNPMIVEFNRLIGVQKINTEIGNKNLNIKIQGYNAEDIEKVSYDVFEGELNLSIVPKAGILAPKKEQIVLGYSGISADTVVLVGGANETHFPTLTSKELEGVKLIHIGTRALNTENGRPVLSFARPASTVSELVATLLVEGGFEMDQDIATNLIMGIEEGSHEFKGPEVTADTFQTVAVLLRAGGQRMPERPRRESFPQGSIPGEQPLEQEKVEEEPAPQDWLKEPKVYKGTSVS
jgi:nanoRNase/pAp phosphatase (c-di-AMP/oligoRNAs hydrolase)